MAEPIRHVDEIGLYAFSRGRNTCQWPTEWCARFCYNRKFYRINPNLGDQDALDEALWQTTGPHEFSEQVKALEVGRFRFAVRGEIWQDEKDVARVAEILGFCPEVLFWIPTRAWRSESMRASIREAIFPLPNSRVMASIDPCVPGSEEDVLKKEGFSTVFTGDNSDPRQMLLSGDEPQTARYTKCPKTWKHKTGHCAVCEEGCFSEGQVQVHLRQHL